MKFDWLIGALLIANVVIFGTLWLKNRRQSAKRRNTFEAARKRELDAQVNAILYPRSRGPHGFNGQKAGRLTTPPILRAVIGGVDRVSSSPPQRKARGN